MRKQSTKWGSGGKRQDRQNSSSKIINESHLPFVLVDDKDATFAHNDGKICDKGKQQPWIVAVYFSLEWQMYCKYFNNIHFEGPAVRYRLWSLQRKMYAKYVNNQKREVPKVNDKIDKIAVVK